MRQHRRLVRQARREATPPLEGDGYRPLLGVATAARGMLSLAAATAVVSAATLAVWTFRVEDPILVVDTTEIDVESVARGTTVGLLAVLVLTGLAFVTWAVQAYRNLPALAIEERRYWTIWLVIGWVIPGANLLVPKLLVDDLWRGSNPNNSFDGGDDWQRRPVASVVNRWWYSFLITPAFVLLAVVTARGGLDDFDRQVLVGGLSVAAAASIVVAALAARGVVAVITVAQARRADVIVDIRQERSAAAHHLAEMERAGL